LVLLAVTGVSVLTPSNSYAAVQYSDKINDFINKAFSHRSMDAMVVAKILSAAGYKGKIRTSTATEGCLKEEIDAGNVDPDQVVDEDDLIFSCIEPSDVYWYATKGGRSPVKIPFTQWSGRDSFRESKDLFEFLVNASEGPRMSVRQMAAAIKEGRKHKMRMQFEFFDLELNRYEPDPDKDGVDALFQRLDKDGNGRVSREEVGRAWRVFIEHTIDDKDLKALLDKATLIRTVALLERAGFNASRLQWAMLLLGSTGVLNEEFERTENPTVSKLVRLLKEVLSGDIPPANSSDISKFKSSLKRDSKAARAVREALQRVMEQNREAGAVILLAVHIANGGKLK